MSKIESPLSGPALECDVPLSEHEEILQHLAEIRESLNELASRVPAAPERKASETANSLATRYQDYVALIDRVRTLAGRFLPFGAVVAVISKGDPEMLTFQGRTGWHFPRDSQGQFTGHHPANSEAAIAYLEDVRSAGAEFLLIPQTSLWWLDYYREFRQHLEARYPIVARNPETGVIFRLRSTGSSGEGSKGGGSFREDVAGRLRDLVREILPDDARLLVISRGEEALLDCGGGENRHFPSTEDGRYLGYHPADGNEVIRYLADEMRRGAQYLVIPAASFWWLDFYSEFAELLSSRCRLVTRQKHIALIYELDTPAQLS